MTSLTIGRFIHHPSVACGMTGDEQPPKPVAVGLLVDTLTTALLIVWAIAALMASVLAPGLIRNLVTPLSAGSMALVGLILLWAVLRNSRILFGVLALAAIGVMVGSWTGMIRWAVPYDTTMAATSMAGAAGIVAVALAFKTIQLGTVGIEVTKQIEQ